MHSTDGPRKGGNGSNPSAASLNDSTFQSTYHVLGGNSFGEQESIKPDFIRPRRISHGYSPIQPCNEKIR